MPGKGQTSKLLLSWQEYVAGGVSVGGGRGGGRLHRVVPERTQRKRASIILEEKYELYNITENIKPLSLFCLITITELLLMLRSNYYVYYYSLLVLPL